MSNSNKEPKSISIFSDFAEDCVSETKNRIKQYYDPKEKKYLTDELDLSNLNISTLQIALNNDIFLIHILKNLTYFYCRDNNLSELPKFEHMPNIKVIDCSYNPIKKIDTYPTLIELNCRNCHISTIDYQPQLTKIDASNNFLDILPIMPNIKKIFISYNRITIIKEYPEATELYCDHNLISKIETQRSLIKLDCSHNKIKHLPILPQLQYIYMYENRIKSLNNKTLPNIMRINASYYYLLLLSKRICDKVKKFQYNISLEKLDNLYKKFLTKINLENLFQESTKIKQNLPIVRWDDNNKKHNIQWINQVTNNTELLEFFNVIKQCFQNCYILDIDIMSEQLTTYIKDFTHTHPRHFENNKIFLSCIANKKLFMNFIKEIYMRIVMIEIIIK
jgi:hypothetical protein